MGWVRLLRGGCKYLVEETLMGGDFIIFWLMEDAGEGRGRGGPPQPALNQKLSGPKFSKLIRRLDSFTQNFPRKCLSFEFIFCLAVQQIYRISFEFSMFFKIQSNIEMWYIYIYMYIHVRFLDRHKFIDSFLVWEQIIDYSVVHYKLLLSKFSCFITCVCTPLY